jgi:hypothetical protein
MNRAGWIVLSAHLSLAAVGLAGLMTPTHAETFTENLHFQVLVGDSVAPHSRLYDSEDYQRMLLLSGDNPPILLELATTSVYQLTREDLQERDDDVVVRDDHEGLLVAAFSTEEGSITVDLGERIYRLAPAPPLVGIVSLEELLAAKPGYASDAEAYRPDSALVSKLKTVDRPIDVYVYFGTWCHLCKNLVPKFLSTVGAVDNPNIDVRYVGVSESLDEPAEWLQRYSALTAPAIIFLEGEKEIGRIEEKAELPVEEAMTHILLGS